MRRRSNHRVVVGKQTIAKQSIIKQPIIRKEVKNKTNEQHKILNRHM